MSERIAKLSPQYPLSLEVNRAARMFRPQGSLIARDRRPTRQPETARRYLHGDPVRAIDWRAYARTGELYVREWREPRSARVAILVAQGETMEWPRDQELKTADKVLPTKRETALRLAYNLAWNHLRMSDQVRFFDVSFASNDVPAERTQKLKIAEYPLRTAGDVDHEFAEKIVMKKARFGAQAESARGAEPLTPEFLEKFDTIYVLGDGIGVLVDEWRRAINREFNFVHVLSPLELETDWMPRQYSFWDDIDAASEVAGDTLRAHYEVRLSAWLETVEKAVSPGCYLRVTADTPIAKWEAFVALLGESLP